MQTLCLFPLSFLLFSLFFLPLAVASTLFFLLPPFSTSSCWSAQKERGEFSTNCFGPDRSGPLPPSISLPSLSPLSLSCSPSLLPLLWQSTPAWSWLHALRVQLPHRPSQPLHSLIPPLDWIFESQAHLCLLLPRFYWEQVGWSFNLEKSTGCNGCG